MSGRSGTTSSGPRRALQGPAVLAASALGWAAAMATSAVVVLLQDDWETLQKIRSVAILFALGGLLGYPAGLLMARLFTRRPRPETAFAACFLSLGFATLAVTVALYGLHYRSYYAQWHEAPLTRVWVLQFAYTVAAAIYQFAVLGLRLYFPVGFLALALVSWRLARRPAL